MKWKPYPAYKDSGIEWLGKVPLNWGEHRLKHTSSIAFSNVDKNSAPGEERVLLCNYTDVYNNDYISYDLDLMEATASPAEIARFKLKRGDVLVTKDSEDWRDIAVPAYVLRDEDDVLCGYHLALIRPKSAVIEGEYLLRAFSAAGLNDQFRVAATGITRYGLGKHWLDNSLFPLPPKEEQRSIAAFLRRETERIDTLIDKKEQQIEFLEEKRAALISHAVTKGLNPNVKMKDSGIEWLGEIPEHWKMRRLKFVSKIQTGLTLGKKYDDSAELVTRPYLRVANVQDGWLDLRDITEIALPTANVKYHELRHGDVLMTEGGDFDKLGRGDVWEEQIPGCLHQNHIFAVRPKQAELNSYFLAAVLTSSHGKNYFTSTSQQTTNLATTNATKLGSFRIPIPPLDEQSAIVASLKGSAGKIDTLVSRVGASIEMLREYRSALISAAVTGKIDVRGEVSA